MIFKLSLSIINYVINPDMLSDKSKGFGKLITNVVISLVLLAITPNLFNAAFNLQTDILKSNAIYQIVTGRKLEKNMTDKDSDFNPNNQAKLIAYGVYSSFIYKDLGDDKDLSKVNNQEDMYAECKEGTTGCDSNTKCSGKNPYCLVAADTVTKSGSDGKDFANTYWFLISTACGGFVAYILLTFCIDASLRAVKLGFLQIIAPVPIMSMIDPKVGNDKVMKWGKECLMTFIDLFIKLAGLFFAVDVITAVISSDGMKKYSDASAVTNPFVQLFIIIGCLMFAKKLPSMLESILGIKLSGGDGFSLKKKLGGAVGLGAVAGVGALGAKKIVAGIDSARYGKGFWNGTKNVQGNGFISKMQKGWNSMTPNRAEFAKQRKTGKEEIKKMDSDWTKGVDVARKLMGAGAGTYGSGPNAWNKVLNGNAANRKYYEAIYRDQKFIDALMNVDSADSLNKEFSKQYRAIQTTGWTGPITVGGTTYTTVDSFIDGMDTQEKILKGATANFESIKKQSHEDAATQAKFNTIKNNKINPTNNAETHASKHI